MKRKPYFTNYRLLAIGLALTVILASCNLPERPTVLPAAEQPPVLPAAEQPPSCPMQ